MSEIYGSISGSTAEALSKGPLGTFELLFERCDLEAQALVGLKQSPTRSSNRPFCSSHARGSASASSIISIDFAIVVRAPQTSSIARAAASMASEILLNCSWLRSPRLTRILRASMRLVIARLICGERRRPKALPA